MLFSAVDDRSGVAYQEYRCVYGEDVAAALRVLFNAMAPKDEPGLVLQGIPAMLYLDNGPVAKSATFRRVMAQLGVDVHTHMPRGSDGRRVTARSKGKSLPRRRPGSSGRSARSRKRTRRSIISTRRKTRPKPIFGCAITWFATTPSHTARNRVRAPRTGYRHCRKPACGRCAPGIRVGAKMLLPGLGGAAAERYGATPSSAGCPMPYRFNEPRRHKIPRARYRVQNWSEYDRALQRRGDLTV